MKKIFILLAGVITITSSCGKLCLTDTAFNFQISVKAYPDRDSIRIGDTIWLEINAPTSLQDISSKKIVDYSGTENLGSAIGFERITIGNPIVSANSFNYILITGIQVSNPNTTQIREFLFVQSNYSFAFKLGIIPKEKGVFGIGFSNAANVYRNSNKCTKALFQINFESTRQHYYLNPYINTTNTDTTKASGSYYFKVY